MFTGGNLIERPHLQPEWWPSSFNYESQAEFGGLDACASIPAGSTIRYAFNDDFGIPISTTTSREAF